MENRATTEQFGPVNQELQQLVHQLRRQQQWLGQLEEFTQAVHGSLHPTEVAYTIANDGRLLLGCDRVSVVLRRGGRYRVIAISGQESINRRANAVRLLEALCKAALATGEPLQYPDPATPHAPQLDQPLNAYLDQVHPKSMLLLPLPVRATPKQSEIPPRSAPTPGGALVVEQFSDARIEDAQRQRADMISRHASTALANAVHHHRIFLRPLWSTLGRGSHAVTGRPLLRGMLIAISLLIIGAVLYFVPSDFALSVSGTLQPEQRRHVFARTDGTVSELLVREGSRVSSGQPLALLRNTELDVKLEEVVGQLRTTSKKLAGLKASRLASSSRIDRDLTQDHLAAAEEEELRQWLASLRQQQALLTEQQSELTVRSPIQGEIISWSVRERLAARPVSRGQLLFTVADLDGPWILELLLPDRRVGHLFTARHELGDDLDVTFILATDPNTELRGRIKEVATSTQVSEDQGQSVLVTVTVQTEQIGLRRSGAGVTAKIHCGSRPLGYVWLHDLFEFVQAKILFRL